MESLKELLTPKTFNKLSFVAIFVWIVLGVTLLGIFADMENSESRFDFRCDGKLSDKDLIRGKCFERYEKQYNKFSIPVYGFVIVNFSVIVIVAVIYSKCIESTVDELEARNTDAEGLIQQGNESSRRLFIAYCVQLVIRFLLGIFFIVLQTRVLYPSKFPSNFECTITREGNSSAYQPSAVTQTQTYECHNQRATKKTFWTDAVTVVNGIFAFVVLMEIVWIMSRARNGRKFMENSQFFTDHLKFKQHGQNPQQVPLQAFIKSMKDTIMKDTQQPTGLEQPIRHNPGEGPKPKDFKIDQIYVNLVICEGRAYYDFPEDRWEQLKVYPKPANVNHPQSKRPDVIIDAQHKNVLVVGRPGIGKTLLSTKLLRMWASDDTFNGDFDVAFLLKFRHFNSTKTNLSFRELLERSETVQNLDDELWDYIIKNPSKVLLIFDGLDEFSARSDIAKDDSGYKNNVEEKMPLHCLYHKIALGKLLDGATVITTTRPTAVKCIRPLNVDRTVEILGFTSQEVEDYVGKFTEGDNEADAKQTIWQHISTNINLFSLCYIPVNCFIICSCLSLHRICGSRLPTKLTEIYSIAVKLFFFRHNEEYRFSPHDSDRHIFEEFQELPSPVQDVFKRLGEIAFNGIKEGRLIFGSKEVNGIEDCGLFHRLPDRAGATPLKPSEAQFCFTHLTIQEFLASKHVIDTMRNEQELRRFVADHINKGAWQLVLQFVAGLLEQDPHRKVPNSDIFTELLPMSTVKEKEGELMKHWSKDREDSEEGTFTCWPANGERHLALNLCKCLYEIEGKQDSAIQNKLTEIGFNALKFNSHLLAPVDCPAVLNVLKNATGMLCMNLAGNYIGPLVCIEIKNWIVNSDDRNNKYCKLRGINLRGNNITDEGVKHLAEALTDNNCKLINVDLAFNNITHEGVKHLAEALTNNNCKLNRLDLTGNNITGEGVKHLAEALTNNNCKLNRLNLASSKITDEGVKQLAEAITNNNCKLNSLDISSNKITDEGVKHLAEALTNNNCKLINVDLSINNITDEGVKHLAEALTNNNCKLNSLTLFNNNITDEGVKHLAEALTNNNCKLNSLTLFNNNITDEGVKHLAEAVTNNNCKLKSLDLLPGNNITDEGVKHLAETLTNNKQFKPRR